MLPFPSKLLEQEEPISKIWIDLHLVSPRTNLYLTEEDIWDGSFVRDVATSSDGEFTVGAAVTGRLSFILNNTDGKFDGYNFRDSTLEAYLGGEYEVQAGETTTAKIRVGTYIVDNYTYDGSNISITCFDYMCKFDKDYEPNRFTYPMQLGDFVEQCCTRCGMTSVNEGEFPNSDFEIQKAPISTSLKYHDLISYAAQIAGCFAKADPTGKLVFEWYGRGFTNIESYGFDGGSFDNRSTSRYMTGDSLYGGSYTRRYIDYVDDEGVERQRYYDGDTADGGFFGDRDYSHIINHLYSLNVSTDDVMITGTRVIVTGQVTVTTNGVESVTERTETVTYPSSGNQGYIIEISGNELVQLGQTSNVAERIGRAINGMKFRPLQANVLEDPSIDAGDTALISDENGAMYYAFISHVTYKNGSSTSIACDAQNQNQNLKNYLTNEDRIKAYINSRYDMTTTSRDLAIAEMSQRVADSPGLYVYTETDPTTYATIYYFVNQKPIQNASTRQEALANSNIQWRLTSDVFSVSTDYGATFNAAITATGDAILNKIYALGLDASHITTGDLTIGGNNASRNVNGHIYIKDSSGNTIITMDKNGMVFSGTASSQMTTITQSAITTTYVNGLNITAQNISAQTISGKAITLGGPSNGDGTLEVKDTSQRTYGSIDNSSMRIGYESGDHVVISPNGGFEIYNNTDPRLSISTETHSYRHADGSYHQYNEAVINGEDGIVFQVNGYEAFRTVMDYAYIDESTGQVYGLHGTDSIEMPGYLYIGQTLYANDIEYTGSFGPASDIRLKKDIEPIPFELARKLVLDAVPVQFRMKNGDGRLRFGFIAQDIREIVSDDYSLVSKMRLDPSREIDEDDEDTYYLGLDYTQFIAPLIAVAQDQETRIAALEEEVDSLKEEVMAWLSSHGEG